MRTNRPCLYAGMGNIGADVFRQASGFGMRYIAHDPYMDEASAKEIGVEEKALDDPMRKLTEMMSFHYALKEATSGGVAKSAGSACPVFCFGANADSPPSSKPLAVASAVASLTQQPE